ncbi:type II toxin-antitoxin system VapC family toxin [Rhodopseudomonas parapalustris]
MRATCWRRTGKARHADCFAYALALTRGEPLLYKGEDFARTEIG